jgi:hypothetical protein
LTGGSRAHVDLPEVDGRLSDIEKEWRRRQAVRMRMDAKTPMDDDASDREDLVTATYARRSPPISIRG